MTTKQQVLQTIQQAWEGTAVGDVCLEILDHLSGDRASQIRVINVTTLENWTANRYPFETLLDAAMYLAGRSPHLLDIQYLFHDGDLEEPLSAEEVREAKRNGSIEHPYSGTPILNYEDHISFYFRPSNDAKQLIH